MAYVSTKLRETYPAIYTALVRHLKAHGVHLHEGSLKAWLRQAMRAEGLVPLCFVPRIPDDLWTATGLACRVVGAFLVDTEEYMSQLDTQAPLDNHVTHIKFAPSYNHKKFRVCLSEDITQHDPDMAMVFQQVVRAGRWDDLGTPESAMTAYRAYKEQRGPRSRPWLHLQFVVPDTAVQTLDRQYRHAYPKLVKGLRKFLLDLSTTDQASPLPVLRV